MIYADNLDAPPNSLLDSTPKPARPIPFCAGDPHIVIALVGVFLAAFVPSSCHRNYIEFCERSLINELIRSKGEKETERERSERQTKCEATSHAEDRVAFAN